MSARCWLLTVCLCFASTSHANLVVLCYHEVTATTEAADRDPLAVSIGSLILQFNWLEANGYSPVSLQQVIDERRGGKPLPENAVLLTFDDGYRSFYDRVMPLLKLYGFPAVLAPVTSWVDAPAGSSVHYGDEEVPRGRFLSWKQLREIVDSDLVEIISHSHDLHRGIPGNPQGNTQPATTTLAFDAEAGSYETTEERVERVREDLTVSAQLFEKRIGYRPRAIAWPYGEYDSFVQEAAEDVGMKLSLTLDDTANSEADARRLHRVLIGSSARFSEFVAAMRGEHNKTPLRAAHVDLDYIFDPDPEQQEQNLGKELDRIKSMQISTVILQAYADPDGDGAADAVYFPNRHLPVRADLFNRVAWQLKTRAGVRVYAWLPVLAFVLPQDTTLSHVSTADGVDSLRYPRLSPFDAKNVALISDVYEDLASSSHFAGILFHDDAVLSDLEDASAPALDYYASQWGLPRDIEQIRDRYPQEFAKHKTDHLIALTQQLAAAVRQYVPMVKTARNIYAPLLIEPASEAWFAQSYPRFLQAYDYTALLAMPYLEKADDPTAWLSRVTDAVAQYPNGLDRTLFELQTVDWHSGEKVSDAELAAQIDLLLNLGARHIAYYPDDFPAGRPDMQVLRERLSLNDYAAVVE